MLTPRSRRRRRAWPAGAAVAGALLVAETGVLLLRPRTGLIPPEPVAAPSYFSADELTRARRFRRPQLAIGLAGSALDLAVLVRLVRRPPAALSAARSPAAVAGAGAALATAMTAAGLPLSALARERARRVGLVTQSWSGWAADVAKAGALQAAFAGAGSAAGIGLVRRAPRTWWLPGAGLVVALGAGLLFAGPVLLDPIFNRFEPLEPGETRDDVLELAGHAGVRVREVYTVDASRRTTAANAYVTGLGATKRVVLFDTLLRDFTRDEVRLVVAHELAHVHHRDVQHGLGYMALIAGPATLAVARLAERVDVAGGEPTAALLPALALAGSAVSAGVGMIASSLSRAIEARADAYALRLTDAPAPFVAFQRRIALKNVADPAPPVMLRALMATHPTTVERIGIARAYERARG